MKIDQELILETDSDEGTSSDNESMLGQVTGSGR